MKAFAALAAENGVYVVAYQPSAQQNGVRRDVAAALLLDSQSGDVVRLPVLAHDHYVVDHGIVARHQLGCGIGKRRFFVCQVAV